MRNALSGEKKNHFPLQFFDLTGPEWNPANKSLPYQTGKKTPDYQFGRNLKSSIIFFKPGKSRD